MTAAGAAYFNVGWQADAGYSAEDGRQLWITNRTLTPFAREQVTKSGFGLYFYIEAATGKITAYSLDTGKLVWGPNQLDRRQRKRSSTKRHTTASAATKPKSQTEFSTLWALEATSGQLTQKQVTKSGTQAPTNY